jgi:hypothetical protein
MLHDTQIAHATRTLGWLGMLASVSWFAYRALRRQGVEPNSSAESLS